jgi:hypothetical protein
MKKNGVKKLLLSRETLRELQASEAKIVVGASDEHRPSCISWCPDESANSCGDAC